ncbi:MAG: signal peptide peptidase SppA [Proteobacteria bacterium]|nr:signal peptide peptidase SppA [Pseudomonadota bacterium]
MKRHPVITFFLTIGFCFSLLLIYLIASVDDIGGGVSIPIGRNVAVIEVNGVIVSSKEIVNNIVAAKRNDNIKGVVVRINSPGGGVAPSQEIYGELKKLGKKKPVVASMSSVAASGGYYVAAAAKKIVANPGTLTGSIGVIMEFSNIEGLLEKVGLKSFVVKSGKYKDVGSPNRPMTDKEKEYIQQLVDSVHLQFVTAVADGRSIDVASVKKIADGRILTGEQALELGLVDKLGSLNDSISLVAEMAGIDGKPKPFVMEKEKGVLDYLLGKSFLDLIGGSFMAQLQYRADYL